MNDIEGGFTFLERADELDSDTLQKRTVDNEFFSKIRSNLISAGAKLLVGPRGTGKTHQMRFVYQECLTDQAKPAAIYSSFSRYVRLEPLLKSSSDALVTFQSWVIAKIAVAGCEFLTDIGYKRDVIEKALIGALDFEWSELTKYIAQIERRGNTSTDGPPEQLNLEGLHLWFQTILVLAQRSRMVIVLDDAALSMTPEYLVEFFNLFQDLKSPTVSPKASVYPGTSQYGPRLHLRHDVQPINAWLSIEDSSYDQTMNQLIAAWEQDTTKLPDGVVDLFKLAAFGVPRVLLTLIRSYTDREWATPQQGVNAVIEEQVALMDAEYQSMTQKVPQFQTVIEAGEKFFKNVVDQMTAANRELAASDQKQLTLGIPAKEVTILHGRMIRFLIEVGFLYPLTSVKHGEDRTYLRFIPHLAPLIHNRAFQVSSGFSARAQVTFIARDKKTQPLRVSLGRLIPDAELKLDLARCTVCHASRISEGQKFCHKCGSELLNASAYEACMALPVSVLPITDRQKSALQSERFNTIGDIIAAQDPVNEVRSPGLIGRKRSMNIVLKAQQYVDEYFS